MPIIAPAAVVAAAAPVVALPATGIDPTATAAEIFAAQHAALTAAQPADAAPVAEVAQPQAEAPAPVTDGAAVAPVNDPAAPPVELTPSQKLAAKIDAKKLQLTKLAAEIEKLEGQFRSADLLDSVKEGSVIKARVGRADTSREVQAAVIGVQTLENGDRRLKIYFGAGFDAETVVIQDSQIIDIVQV